MTMMDLLRVNNVNLDILTENFNLGFYGRYLAKWPEYCRVAVSSIGVIQGYVMGKVEGDQDNEEKQNWHGHVTAVTVAPEFRRQGLATSLMQWLEDVTANRHNGYFVDLFVRKSNEVAIGMYRRMGYDVYQVVAKYYAEPEEDSFDMRKSMPRDPGKITMQPTGKVIKPSQLEFH